MARKKVVPESKADVVNKIFAEVDAEVFLAGMLGATAAAGGLTPPLTRLLQTFNTGMSSDYSAILAALSPAYAIGTVAVSLADLIMGNKDSQIDEKDRIKVYGLMASGALEAMIMMELVKNKQLMGQFIDVGKGLATATIAAAGEAVPF